MTEHHPDMDLIMALAAGELPPEEATRIESRLDPEARAELESQRAALAMLGELPRPSMTVDESRRLRAAIREELGLDPGHVEPARSRRRSGRWFARALPAMAAAASLVAVIAIAVNLADRPMQDEEASQAAATMAPRTTAAPATTAAPMTTTTAARMVEATLAAAAEAMEEEPMAEEPMAEEAMEEEAMAQAAMEEAAMLAGDAADEAAAAEQAPTTTALTTTAVTDTTEGERTADLAFSFSTDRPDDALLFTDSVLAEAGREAFPLVELADRAAADGLVCWVHVADAADPPDGVSFMGYGLIDGEEGEAYRIEPGASLAQQDDERPPVILLFAYPDCRPVDFRAG